MNKPTHLGIVGSRDWPTPNFVLKQVGIILHAHPTLTTIVSGGQPKGVDAWAKRIAAHLKMEYVEHAPAHKLPRDHPRYSTYHVSNYHKRNALIVQDSHLLVAFRYEMSSGTTSTILMAQKVLPEERVFIFDLSKEQESSS